MKVVPTAQDAQYAIDTDETKPFMDALLELCAQHNLALVPVRKNKPAFYDALRVVPVDADVLGFLRESEVCVEPSTPEDDIEIEAKKDLNRQEWNRLKTYCSSKKITIDLTPGSTFLTVKEAYMSGWWQHERESL